MTENTNINNLMDIGNPKLISINLLKQHPENPRKQNKKAMEFLEKSFDNLGTFRSLLCNNKNEVLAGNQLLSIFKKKRIKEVFVIYPIQELTKEQEQAIIVADNQNSFHRDSNSWDIDIMGNTYSEILQMYDVDPINIDFNMGNILKNTPTIPDTITDDIIKTEIQEIKFFMSKEQIEDLESKINQIQETEDFKEYLSIQENKSIRGNIIHYLAINY